MEEEDRWSNISKMLDYTQFEAIGQLPSVSVGKC